MSGGGESTDLNTKYQKLATEYAKLRSQVAVLKKGVIDGQDKNTQFSDQLHEKETQLRKNESEMQGVLFRNQQLTRRVNVLQDEIDTLQSKSKSKHKTSSIEEKELAERVINEELVAKITENARLHATLDDIEKQYESTIQSLQSRIQELEREKAELGLAKRNREEETSQSFMQITKENDDLRARVTLLERDLAVRSKQNESLELQVTLLAEKNRALESVGKSDFSSQFTFVDPQQTKLKEKLENEVHSLNERLTESLDRQQEMEKDREHWKLEFQLAQVKLQKAAKQPIDQQGDSESELTSLSKEKEIKSMFETRLGELVEDRIESDSKSTAYYLECQALSLKITKLEEELSKVSDKLVDKSDMLVKGEEEIKTMQVNYEEQLSVMSEHLAEMNTKLASQEDVIIHLRQESDQTDAKKKKK